MSDRPLALRRTAAGAALGAGATTLAAAALLRRPPGGHRRWGRVNFRGRPVTLLAGPAVAAGPVAAALLCPPRVRAAAVVAVGGAAAFGVHDDLAGGTHARGFRGHLRALRAGEVTSGLVKLAGIGAASAAAAAALERHPADLLLTAGLVAGTANLANLLDVRPGRALKAALFAGLGAAAAGGTAAPLAAGAAAAAAATLPADLGERVMIGDGGANAVGAALGVALAAGRPRRARAAAFAVVAALTAASEVVSFTEVIDRTPPLRALDRLGRLPADAGSPVRTG